MKQCSKCKEWKNKSKFYRQKLGDGYRSICKKCDRLAEIKRNNKKREKYNENIVPEYKICNQCNLKKHKHEFNKVTKNKDGLSNKCKKCIKENIINKPKNNPKYKRCRGCGQTKKYTEYSKKFDSPDGLDHKCKQCKKKYNKEYSTKIKNKKKVIPKYKTCCECQKTKSSSKFGKTKYSNDGLRPMCKSCDSGRSKKFRKDHPDVIREYKKTNKQELIKKAKKYREENYDKFSKWYKEYSKNTINYTEKTRLRKEISKYEEIKKAEDGSLLAKCTYCGEWYAPARWELKVRLAAIEGKYSAGTECRLYCSNQCKEACPTFRIQWYSKDEEQGTSREVQPQLRQLVLARDTYTCQKCGKHKDELEVPIHCHHIDPVVSNPIESADTDNCITLCEDCHKEVHKIPGCGYSELRCASVA